MLATYRWKTQCLVLCSESNICDLMTNYVRGWRRKKMMFNSASSRSRRLPALKRGKVLLKTEAKHYWLIDSDEARSRSIHHSQRNLTHYLGSTPGDATHGPSNQHWHWFTNTHSQWSTSTTIYCALCRICSISQNSMYSLNIHHSTIKHFSTSSHQ